MSMQIAADMEKWSKSLVNQIPIVEHAMQAPSFTAICLRWLPQSQCQVPSPKSQCQVVGSQVVPSVAN